MSKICKEGVEIPCLLFFLIQNDSRKKYMALNEGEWNSLGYARRALGGANRTNSSMVERQTLSKFGDVCSKRTILRIFFISYYRKS